MRFNKMKLILVSIILLSIIIAINIIYANKYLTSKEISKINNNYNNSIENEINKNFIDIENVNRDNNNFIENQDINKEGNVLLKSEIDNKEDNVIYEENSNIDKGVENLFINTTEFEEFSEETYKLTCSDTLESESKYITKRLLLTINNKEEFETFGAKSVVCFDKLAVLTYETEEETEKAYKNFLEDRSINSVEIDSLIETSSITRLGNISSNVENGIKTEMNKNNSVIVAVLDSGIDLSNPIFDNRILDSKLNLSTSGEKDSVQDDNGHGTAVSSIIVKNSNAYIMPFKIANSNGKGTILNVYLAIKEAIENNVDIINLSLTTTSSELLTQVIEDAHT